MKSMGSDWECSNDSTITVYEVPEDYKRNTGLVDQYGDTIYVIEKKERVGYL